MYLVEKYLLRSYEYLVFSRIMFLSFTNKMSVRYDLLYYSGCFISIYHRNSQNIKFLNGIMLYYILTLRLILELIGYVLTLCLHEISVG